MSLSPSSSTYKLGQRPLPPPFQEDEHYHTLLNQYETKALAEEKARVESLKEHELQYTTIEEYQHALARERRHSLSLVQELSQYKFHSRYQSCQLYSEAEINEEAKVNLLIKNIEGIIKEKNEDKVRTVMELEREEERMINVLMERLERVNREKGMLERQIYGVGGRGGVGSRFESMEGVELVVPAGAVGQQREPQSGSHFHDVIPKCAEQESTEKKQSESEVFECEEEEDGDDQDILDDKFHDPDMEKELDDLLEKKNVGK